MVVFSMVLVARSSGIIPTFQIEGRRGLLLPDIGLFAQEGTSHWSELSHMPTHIMTSHVSE